MTNIIQKTIWAHRLQRALGEVYQPKPAARVFQRGAKEDLYTMAAETIGDGPLTYLEFGVFKGWSIGHISARFRNPNATFVGFDSFEGLPERWGSFEVAHFATSGVAPQVRDKRIHFVKGWFQDTVPVYVKAHAPSVPLLVHFDADLYSSTLFLLTTLWHYCPEYYFLFDEFVPDEVVALHDFASAYPVEIEFLACTHVDERPMQVFGRMKNVCFNLGPDTEK